MPVLEGCAHCEESGIETIPQAVEYLPGIEQAAIKELLKAKGDESLRSFTSRHYPFVPTTELRENGLLLERRRFEEHLAVAYDMKGILTLVFGLRSLIDNDQCTEKNLGSLGVELERPSPDTLWADAHVALLSSDLHDHLRTAQDQIADDAVLNDPEYFVGDPQDATAYFGPAVDGDKPFYNPHATTTHLSLREARERSIRLFLTSERLESVDDDEPLPILHFHVECKLDDSEDPVDSLAMALLDVMAERLVGHIETRYERGRELQTTTWPFNSFWKLLFQEFCGSRALECVICGRRMLVSDERGMRRKYCSDACNKKAYRIRKYYSLVHDEHLDEETAARKAAVSRSVAKRCIARHPEEFCKTDSM